MLLAITAAAFFLILMQSDWSEKTDEVVASEITALENNHVVDDPLIDTEKKNPYLGYISSRCLLTENEKKHYWRLQELMPNTVLVHTQISFNSLLKCDEISIRNRYNRGVVDMVISDLEFNPLAIVEVDDPSHKSRKVRAKDEKRDEMTMAAGLATVRINDSTTNEELLLMLDQYLPVDDEKPRSFEKAG